MTPTRIWDLPVRLVHWLVVPLAAFSWWSGEEGHLDWHRLSGFTLLTLVLFRLAWGVFGSQTARFAQFLRGPRAIGAYLKQKPYVASVGHNPLGGWAVAAMLALMATQAALGLFAVDVDGIESGPLAVFVSFDVGRAAAKAHHLVFNILLALIVLHVAAIAFYALVKRDNLIGPMITGAKAIDPPPASAPAMAPWWLALALGLASALFVFAASKAFWLF
jgi:cytochrome b